MPSSRQPSGATLRCHAHGRLRDRGRARLGFTLTELVAVMTVVAILGGMAVTSLTGLVSSRQDVGATRVRTALMFAQEWAMGSGNDTWVEFDLAADRASVFVEDPLNPGKAGRLTLADPLKRTPLVLELGTDGVGIESAAFGATNEVQFDSLGAPSDGNGTPLATDGLVSVTGGVTVRVTRNTGLVTID